MNRCPSKSLDNKIIQEAWNGMKPTVSHIRIFESIAYVYVPSQRRYKLDDRSEKHVLVGYDKQSKDYKLYNPVTRKVAVSRDVEFKEEGSWDWITKEHERYDFIPMTNKEETGELVFEDVIKSTKCRQAMDEEIKSIEKNDTWELITLLKTPKAIKFKLGLESVSIRRIQCVGYGVLEFLGVGTTFDIFQNILFPYSLNTAYCLSWIRRIGLVSFVVFGECRHRYAVSSLMDTAYWLSEQ
ncbi:retrovirus-related pol polyprotein from transposon TNT 1-94 [Tanacetum coccineum]